MASRIQGIAQFSRLLSERFGYLLPHLVRYHRRTAAALTGSLLRLAHGREQPRLHALLRLGQACLRLGDGLFNLSHVHGVASSVARQELLRVERTTELHFLHQDVQPFAEVFERALVRGVVPGLAHVALVLELG